MAKMAKQWQNNSKQFKTIQENKEQEKEKDQKNKEIENKEPKKNKKIKGTIYMLTRSNG